MDTKIILRRSRLAAVLLAIVVVAGCGGGGSGSSVQGGRVTGRVFASPGRSGRSPVTVSCDGTTLSTVAGADGRFMLDGVPSGLQTIYAHSNWGAIAVVARINGGGETQVGNLELADAGQISGLVTAAVDGRTSPVARAKVTISPIVPETGTDTPFPVRTTRTNPQGSYTVIGLPIGSYVVSVSAEGFQSASVVAEVTAGRTAAGDVSLISTPKGNPGSMSGHVVLKLDDGATTPLAGALVRVAKSDMGHDPTFPMPGDVTNVGNGKPVNFGTSRMHPIQAREFYAFTDEQGNYKIEGIPPGEYVAAAVRAGLMPDRKSVTIAADRVLEQSFELGLRKQRAGIVNGVVSDAATGQPIAGANIWVHFMPPPPYELMDQGDHMTVSHPANPGANRPLFLRDDLNLQATTDSAGRYRLIVPDGLQTLSAYADGYLGSQVEVSVSAGGETTANIGLEKDPGQVTVKGRAIAKSPDGSVVPVAGANIWASPWGIIVPADNGILPGPEIVYTAVSGVRGEFTLTLPAGKYTVGAESDRLFAEPREMNIGADTKLEIVLQRRQ